MAEDESSDVSTESIIKVSGSSNPERVGSILARAISAGYTPKMLDSKADLKALIDGAEMFRGFSLAHGYLV